MNNLLQASITGYADGSWPKMIDASEVESITGISAVEILDFAKSGLCPHVLVAKKDIKFIKSHILRWLKENMLETCEGESLKVLPVAVKEARVAGVPRALSMIVDRLAEVPYVCGVYFLVKGSDVVYVGQSINVTSRMVGHKSKDYDRVYVLPCPPRMLNKTEAAFIGLLKPPLNMSNSHGRFMHNDMHAFEHPESVIDLPAHHHE